MRSLRFVLAGWMVTLLGAVLLVIGILAYRTSGELLIERQQAARELEQIRMDERLKEQRERLDRELLDQAQTLARLMQFQLDWGKFRHRELHILGLFSIASVDKAFVMFPGWLAPQGRSPLAMEFFRRTVPEIRFNDTELQQHLDDIAEYFQVDTTWGSVFRSASLGEVGMELNQQTFSPDQILHHEFDTIDLRSGIPVRRVRLKAPAGRMVPLFGMMRRPPGNGGEGRGMRGEGIPDFGQPRSEGGGPPRFEGGGPPRPDGGGGPPRFDMGLRTLVYIQCASPISRLDPVLASIRAEHDQRIEQLESASQRNLANLAWQLTGLGGATFALAIAGTMLVVSRVLNPLKRLSDAVSQVTERDFELRVSEQELPEELHPVFRRLQETLHMLERAFLREKQATADISHELRTPLASMITTLELALRRSRSVDEYRSFLEDCRSSASHMRAIVERLLTLARLDAGSDPVRPRLTNVSDLAEACAQLVRPVAMTHGVTLEVTADQACWLMTDADKLRESLCNLLHNAVQYNHSGGEIHLRVRPSQEHVVIEVSDTGIGIPADQLELIFERFHRVDPSRHGDGSNAGLGLAIVKAYVTLMGGAIAVESEPGSGTTFRLHLPQGQGSRASARTS